RGRTSMLGRVAFWGVSSLASPQTAEAHSAMNSFTQSPGSPSRFLEGKEALTKRRKRSPFPRRRCYGKIPPVMAIRILQPSSRVVLDPRASHVSASPAGFAVASREGRATLLYPDLGLRWVHDFPTALESVALHPAGERLALATASELRLVYAR